MNNITMTLQVDHLIMEALREDISSEDVDVYKRQGQYNGYRNKMMRI